MSLQIVLKSGVKSVDIAVISPHKDQAALIKEYVDYESLEVDTVDGF